MANKNSFQITGGTPLHGSVRVGGAKNASYKLMIGALLGSEESRLLNFSRISDVEMVAEVINSLGARAYKAGERTFFIDPQGLNKFQIAQKYGQSSRATTLFAGPLLAKFKQASFPLPGGDKIGKRPLERHFEGLKSMGVKIERQGNFIHLRTSGLKGTTYTFAKNSHTGTETLIMAAVLAEGETILKNAAQEPEVDDLIEFLNKMGAQITRNKRIIVISGTQKLGGAIHKIIPDRNEAVSYACAALITKGDIIVQNARPKFLQAFLDKVEEIGGGYEVGNYGIRFFYQGKLRSTQLTTQIHPGFMTDWQPLWAVLMTQAEGESTIHETIMQQRFQYAKELAQMGAKIEFFQPKLKNPEAIYNFNLEDDPDDAQHAIKIIGPTKLSSGKFSVKDLRHGATLVLAAMAADGVTTLSNIEQIDRGYENLDTRLCSMGAKIQRVSNS